MGSYDSADIANLVLFISEIRLLKFSNVCNRILYMARYIDDGTLITRSSNDQIMFDLHEMKMYYPSNETNFIFILIICSYTLYLLIFHLCIQV